MSEADFDIIVVGSGFAGATAAYVAAKKGKSVLVIERGEYAGAKNMTGGRVYAHSLKSVFDDYSDGEVTIEDIPFERKITHERIAMIDTSSQMAVDFTSDELGTEGADSYSVLRGPFDQWLAAQAENAGAEYIYGIAVEELIKDDAGKIAGVKAGEDTITANVVIVAEGVNNLLTERSLGASRPAANEMAVGIKEVFELPSSIIEDRFLLPKDEGAAMLFVGDCTHGNVGGGFLYTNKDSISIGLVATIKNMETADTTIYQSMDDFKKHPAVAPILKDAKLLEHSGHMVSEGGYNMMPEYVYDGCLVAGDAAMLCMNLGYQVRGMDFAAASGRFAAEAACEAIDAGNTGKSNLMGYRERMENSFVESDLKTFKGWPEKMENWPEMFTDYPTMVREMLNAMFCVDGKPQEHLKKRMMPLIKQRGVFKLLGQMKGALKVL